MIKIIREETSFQLEDEDGHKVWLSVDYQKRTIDITDHMGRQFVFLDTRTGIASAIGRLIVEAAEIGSRELLNHDVKKEI